MDYSTMDPFEWEQYQIEDIIGAVLLVLYSILFFGHYFKSKLRVHLLLASSTSLEAIASFLYAFARPACNRPGLWAVFLEGQLERLTEIGAYALYALFVISRLEIFDTLSPGIRKWAKPLQVSAVLFLIAHLVRQFFVDLAIYSDRPPPSDDITSALYLVSMLYMFAVNFSINLTIAKRFIRHALECSNDKELEKDCKRLRVLVYYSITSTVIASVIFNISFDPHDLALFHSVNMVSQVALSSHFYLEWLYQVLLTKIITTKKFDVPKTSSSSPRTLNISTEI